MKKNQLDNNLVDYNSSGKDYKWLFPTVVVILILATLVYGYITFNYLGDWKEVESFGNSFGALNALFSGIAIAGVVVTIHIQRRDLSLQRTELRLQLKEMTETRNEFLLARVTNLIYSQLERFEYSLNNFNLQINNNKFSGAKAVIKFLDKYYQNQRLPNVNSAINYTQDDSTYFSYLLIWQNADEIIKFSTQAYNSMQVIKKILDGTSLEGDKLNLLKEVYFDNLGENQMQIFTRFLETSRDARKLMKGEIKIYNKVHLQPDVIQSVEDKLSEMIDFYKRKIV